VTAVEDVTGFAEILGGRVKTLHPNVHAGLLADTRIPEHLSTIEGLGIAPFDLVVSNLYPFRETVASGAAPDEVVEQIGRYAALGAQRVYLQALDVHDLDHLRLLAAEVMPHV
jgi:AICAR transformylase/IMP cyclohydrolase PurH